MMELTKGFKANAISIILSKNNALRAAFLFGFAAFSSWVPMFNLWLESKGMTGLQIGIIAAIPWLLILFVQPFWGMLADKFGKLICFKISLAGSVAMFTIFPFAPPGVAFIATATVLLSLFYSPVLPLLDSIALDKVEDQQINSYSTIRFWGAVGYALGASVTGWLIPQFGVQAAFSASAFFSFLVLLAALRISETKLQHKGLDVEFKYFAQIISNKVLLLFLLVIFVVSVGQSAITFFLSLYMQQIGSTPEITGFAIAMEGISELPFYFIAAWLLQRTAPGKIVLFAILATALRLFLYSVNTNPNMVILIESMNGLTWTLLWVSSVEFVNNLIPPKWRTTGQSMLWAAYFGAGAVSGNIICGWLYEKMAMSQIYSTMAVMILISAFVSFFILVKRKSNQTNL